MATRNAKPGQSDQRKVYLNWANHHLRKLSDDGPPLTELKEIGDGLALPRVLKAVVQEAVPNIHSAVSTEDQRKHNIEKCIDFLNKFGVNCSTFTIKDLCDAKDRAVLSLFYSLSQYKRSPSSTGSVSTKNGHAPSKLVRPTSPSLKATHGVTVNGTAKMSPTAAHQKEFNLTASTHSTSPPATSPISPNPSQKVLGPRRTAGSHIMTSTTPYMQRKPQQKTATVGTEEAETGKVSQSGGEKIETKELVSSSNSIAASSEVNSDPEAENPANQKQLKSRLVKHGSFSYGHSHQVGINKESRLHKPAASKDTTAAEEAESATPPSHSKLNRLLSGLGKMPGHKGKDSPAPSSAASSGDAPEETASNEHSEPISRPPSRLKVPASGRSTPSNMNRTGIQRPSSRLSKTASSSISNLSKEGVGEGEESVKSLRLQRKSSDGAAKRHLVAPSAKSLLGGSSISSGSSSLPRHLPKGLMQQSGSKDHTPATPSAELSSSTEDEGKPATKPVGQKDNVIGKGEGVGLRKPTSGLKKPGAAPQSGVRTPNLPSSDAQTSTISNESKERANSLGGGAEENHISYTERSPTPGRKLVAPKASTMGSRPFGLKRPTSPSSRLKLHKIAPATGSPATQPSVKEKVGGAETLPPRDAELCSSNSSLESCEVKRILKDANTLDNEPPTPPPSEKPLEPPPIGPSAAEPSNEPEKPQPLAESAKPDVLTPPADSKEEVEAGKGKESPMLFGRRISPEGMSHEETTSPRVEASAKQVDMPPVKDQLLSSVEDSELSVSMEKEKTQRNDVHQSRGEDALSIDTPKSPRARSLSPKASHRLMPKGMSRVRDLEGGMEGGLMRVNSSESTSSEGTPSLARKPLKSSLRQKRSGSKSRHSSSSSREGVVSPAPRHPKVTISPRSSQVVYDPEETGLSRPPNFSTKFLVPGGAISDRPSSYTSLDSSTTSESLSPSSSSHTLFTRGGGVVRHTSLRSTLSEQLDYRTDQHFLGNEAASSGSSEIVGSTPELIESFENQLTNMKAELSDKDHMLSLYASSMADLSTKMNMLKKSLEEKDNAIRHLTEKQTWYDLEGHSLMASRSTSVAGDHEPLSDGYLSDSAMEEGKDKGKKKKIWKFSFRNKKKDDSTGVDHLSNADTESVISSRTTKSHKKPFGKKKAPDLVSISEYPTESRYRDIDTKSTYTMDMRSEYGGFGGGGGLLPLWEEDPVKVYDDPETGARAEVILFIDTNETKSPAKSPANDSGYYGDLLSRHGNKQWNRDSIASSVSSDSGNHGDEASEQFIVGTLSISPELSWVSMDSKVAEIFHHHIMNIDPEGSLGLTEESIYCYVVGDERRQLGNALLPPVTPYQALANKLTIKVHMKGAGQQTCDSLAYKTLMGMESLQSYMAILQETQWLVVMGTKGTCKSSLVSGLAHHLSSCLEAEEGEGMEDVMMGVVGGEVIRYNLDKDGVTAALKYFKTDLAKRVQLQLHPPILVLEDIYECKDLEQLLVAAGGLSRRPYIIAALSSGTTKGVPLHQLMSHHQIRVVNMNPQADPVMGILARSLRKQIYQLKATAQSLDPVAERLVNWVPYLLNHLNFYINKFHSNVVNLGPRVFMGCPLGHSGSDLEGWFLSLWNHFIIPYLMGTIMAGIETYTADPMLEWVDVREWVVETYPWPSAINVGKLKTLNPEDVGWNHAVRPHQSRYIMFKDDKMADDTRSLLRQETQSMIH